MIGKTLDLSQFPRFQLMEGRTPIQRLQRLSSEMGDVGVYVKRDDLTGVGGGGNKLRKLEFLMGEAIAQGADTIITVGARQSNHARLTAAAAARAGMKCELVLVRAVPRNDEAYCENGNILLDTLLGATIHDLPASADALNFATQRAAEMTAQGHRVYVCPLGGSSPLGCLGYASCAQEIENQAAELELQFEEVVVPHGSGGMHAGLVAGFVALETSPGFVRAHSVLANETRARDTSFEKVMSALGMIAPTLSIEASDLNITDAHLGEGYGIPTDSMREAVRLLATTEGLLIDPVYGGKAFAGLLQDIRSGRYHRGQKVLFIMTGGLPGLFAYRSAF